MSKTDNHTAPQFDTSRFTMMSMSRIELNEGQLAGLPANPRGIKQKKFEKLKKNIERYPEMLVARSLLVYPLDDDETQFIIIGGNMRYRAMLDLGHTNAPVFIIPRETPVERLMAYTILDNGDFGDWDWDLLANEWPEEDLNDWGVKIPGKSDNAPDLSDRIDLEYKIEIDCGDEATQEKLFNKLTEEGYLCRLLTL
ncbi:MAG: hypothetical protein NC401_10475 [Ruminococcus sp.]|nr:hypothetical protein [Ruminococcus sp.]